MCRPNRTITSPATRRIQTWFERRNCPSAVAEAPRATNTSMNPRMKRSECRIVSRRTRARASGPGAESSSNVSPVMKER